MRAPQLVVVVPDPGAFPSGGNVFNARVLDGLSENLSLTVHRVGADEALPVLEPGARVLVDTLLMAAAEPALARAGERGLLVHHLESFDSAVQDGERARRERALLPGYSFFITTSAYSRDALRALGVRGAIDVVYPGLDETFLDAPAARDEQATVRVLTVANLIARKGLMELATLLAGLAELRFEWTVIGSDSLDPEYARRFHALCAELGLAARVRVVEAASAEAMRAYYDASDLLLSGARFETLGMALREAMARALPVLGWDVGGSRESVIDGATGYLVEPGDSAGFTTKLRALIERAELRRRLGLQARAQAAAFPTWPATRVRFAAALAGHPS